MDQQNPLENMVDENQIIALRREKLNRLREKGGAYPNDFKRTDFAQDLHDEYDNFSKEDLEEKKVLATVSGRMMLKRVMGKASFATLQDMTGTIQLYISKQLIGEELYEEFKHFDLGDILGAKGEVFKTNHGELSVRVTELRLLVKSLRPLPEKHKGLSDQEQRYRQRYVDLMVNQESRDVFKKRSQILQAVREYMLSQNYLEVETPMMHSIPGGATAKPFETYHNTLDMTLYLRVAPELFLKRLVIGGFERVFELNRSFRNEGISTRHNPEFTMMEFYEAYSNYERMMALTEAIIKYSAMQVRNSLIFDYNGREVNLDKPFDRLTVVAAIYQYNPEYSLENLNDIDWLKTELAKRKIEPTNQSLGSLQFALFEETTEEKLWNPTYIIDYPIEISPLARRSDVNPDLTERFELFVVGRELANGYSELNDPEDQAQRFKQQAMQKDAGDEEAMHYDADYIRAMEYGLPPTGGGGIGVDRLVMLLTDSQSIRDVILFPQMRKEDNH
ncbi:lysine--tRNA ligase [Neisseriaceae bacterium PsAf]|nr:lysine--tRNA ligase [Neisseriaceae bacterium PsAf]